MAVCGVYKIRFKGNDNHLYVGSSVCIKDRTYRHLTALRKQKHNNPILQRLYNKYGENAIVFETIEVVATKSTLASREQYYIDTLNPDINILRNAYNCLGYKHSEESKRKISIANRGQQPTDEQRAKNSMAQKGNKYALNHRMTETGKQTLRELRQRKVINIVSGNILDSIGDLAALLNLKYSTMYARLSGHNQNNTDWRFLNES